MSVRPHVVIFAKAPRLGTVKTRLARDIGALAALRFHRHQTERLVRTLGRDRRWHCWLAITPDREARRGGIAQGRGDLGARMARVVGRLPPGPVIIVGTDIPDLGRRHIVAAVRALGRADAVFGPTPDGGYWLVGLRRRPAAINPFGGVRWSSRHALADTRAGFDRRQRVVLLETLEDIDDGASWRRYQARRRVRS